MRRGAEAPDDLPASWGPISAEDAAGRARTFALQAALVWSVESLSGYVSSLMRSAPALLAEQLKRELTEAGSREKKLTLLRSRLGLQESSSSALVRAALVWRNKITHVFATNRVDPAATRFLMEHRDEIRESFQGLQAEQMLDRIRASQAPRLKEVSAVNRAMAAVTKEIDAAVCAQVDIESYFSSIIVDHLEPEQTRSLRAHGLWGGTTAQNRRSLLNLAAQYGLQTDADMGISSDLPALTSRGAMARLGLV